MHGWAGWRSLQFVDPEDEASFRAEDYKQTHWLHVVTLVQFYIIATMADTYHYGPCKALALAMTIIQSLAMAKPASTLGVISSLNVVCELASRPSVHHNVMGVLLYTACCSEWLLVWYLDASGTFCLLQSDCITLLSFYGVAMCQALVTFHAFAYSLRCTLWCVATTFIVPLLYLWNSNPDPAVPLLLTPYEFYRCFCLMCVCAATYMQSNVFMRRLYTAQQHHVADALRGEKERLGYELAFARKKSQQAHIPAPRELRSLSDGSLSPAVSEGMSAFGDMAHPLNSAIGMRERQRTGGPNSELADRQRRLFGEWL